MRRRALFVLNLLRWVEQLGAAEDLLRTVSPAWPWACIIYWSPQRHMIIRPGREPPLYPQVLQSTTCYPPHWRHLQDKLLFRWLMAALEKSRTASISTSILCVLNKIMCLMLKSNSRLTYSFNSLQILWKHLCVAQGRGAFKRMNRFEPPFIIRIRPQSYTG